MRNDQNVSLIQQHYHCPNWATSHKQPQASIFPPPYLKLQVYPLSIPDLFYIIINNNLIKSKSSSDRVMAVVETGLSLFPNCLFSFVNSVLVFSFLEFNFLKWFFLFWVQFWGFRALPDSDWICSDLCCSFCSARQSVRAESTIEEWINLKWSAVWVNTRWEEQLVRGRSPKWNSPEILRLGNPWLLRSLTKRRFSNTRWLSRSL